MVNLVIKRRQRQPRPALRPQPDRDFLLGRNRRLESELCNTEAELAAERESRLAAETEVQVEKQAREQVEAELERLKVENTGSGLDVSR